MPIDTEARKYVYIYFHTSVSSGHSLVSIVTPQNIFHMTAELKSLHFDVKWSDHITNLLESSSIIIIIILLSFLLLS